MSQFTQTHETLSSLMMHIIFSWTTVTDGDSGSTWKNYEIENSKACLCTSCYPLSSTFGWGMMNNIWYATADSA